MGWFFESRAHRASRARSWRPMVEPIEGRQLLSASPLAAPTSAVVATTVQPIGVTFITEAGESFNGVVGKVKGLAPSLLRNASGLQATITWGDAGTAASRGELSVTSAGVLVIRGSHTYSARGKYALTINVLTVPLKVTPPTALIEPLVLATVHSHAIAMADVAGGRDLIEVATQKFTAQLGTFEFANVDFALTAQISWGDGTESVGAVVRTGDRFDDWAVLGTHTYSHTGLFNVSVNVTGSLPINPTGVTPPFEVEIANFKSSIRVMGWA